jgi:hypothetical protein
VKAAIADVGATSAWTTEQRRALRAAFQAVGDALDQRLLLRGVRRSVEVTVDGGMETVVDCPFRPRAVHFFSAYQPTSDGDKYIANPIFVWRWTGTPDSGSVYIADDLGLLADGSATLDIFLERAD